MESKKRHKMLTKDNVTTDLSSKKKRKLSKSESKKLAKLIDKKLNLSDITLTAKRSTSKLEKEKLAALFGPKVTLPSAEPETRNQTGSVKTLESPKNRGSEGNLQEVSNKKKSKKKKNKENSCPKTEATDTVSVQTQDDGKETTLSSKRKRKSPKSDSAKLAKLMSKKLNLSDTTMTGKGLTSEKQKLAALFGDKVTSTKNQKRTESTSTLSEDTSEITRNKGKISKKKSKKKKDIKENSNPSNDVQQTAKNLKEMRQMQSGEDMDDEENKKVIDAVDKMAGFCPPPGIVHESLLMEKQKKKREKSDLDEEEEKPKGVKGKRDTSKDSKTVFVGNLPVNTDKKELHKLFRKFGSIETVRLRCVPRSDTKLPKRAAVILKDFHPERDNICAYVCFKEEESAQKALKMNGKLVKSFHIRVDMSNHDPKTDFKRSIFVGNLPLDIKEEDVRSHFDSCGKIRNVRVIRDRKSGVGKGICYVTFKSKDSVGLAMKLRGTVLSGRKARIEYCLENPPKEKKVKKEKKRPQQEKRRPQQRGNKHEKKQKFHTRPSNVKSSAVFQKKIRSKQKKKRKSRQH